MRRRGITTWETVVFWALCLTLAAASSVAVVACSRCCRPDAPDLEQRVKELEDLNPRRVRISD
jgi:hypothetical protein